MVDLVSEASAAMEALFRRQDADQSGALDVKEWGAINWADDVKSLAPTPLEWWDKDGDGTVTLEECRRGVRVAFCLERSDGTPLRSGMGIVFNLGLFVSWDADRSGTVSREEFVSRYHLGPEKSAEKFAELDKAQKASLTFAELAEPILQVSIIELFLNLDVDLDGGVTESELLARSSPNMRAWAERLFPGCDADSDGKLSFREFQMMPLADASTSWNYIPYDADRDGTISPAEFRPMKELFTSGLSYLFFRRFDRNGDGQLSHDEFFYSTDPARLPREVAFRWRDQNKDGKLSLSEVFPDKRPDGQNAARLRRYLQKSMKCEMAFQATDVDRSGDLSLEEFTKGPFAVSSIGDASPSPLPDPVLELVEQELTSIFPLGREPLTPAEWIGLPWETACPDFIELRRSNPDRDDDGKVSREEARFVMEIALGVRRGDGLLVRFPEGQVLINMYFDVWDTDHDGKLSEKEFSTRYHAGPDAGKKQFLQVDADRDGFAVPGELGTTLSDDRIGTFLNMDQDLDGRVTVEEVAARSRPWDPAMIPPVFAAFDQDQSGSLSFHELCLSPFLNRVREWHRPRRDVSGDAALSYEEYRLDDGLFASALGRRFYRLLDRNRDGQLGLDEFIFTTDPAKVPRELAFRWKDLNKDGKLSFAEVYTDKLPEGQDADRLRRYIQRRMRCEMAFRATDLDRDDALSKEEFTRGAFAASSISDASFGPIPDPVLDQIEEVTASLFGADRETVTLPEWRRIPWETLQPDFVNLRSENPDQDGNGSVSRPEVRRLVEIALGVRRADGEPMRSPEGHVFINMYFDAWDTNHDGRLTEREFSSKYYAGPQAGTKLFRSLDGNHDGFAVPSEIGIALSDDRIGTFLTVDKNLDGSLTVDELTKQSRPWDPLKIPSVFAAFDADANGNLSFQEFCMSPFLNRVRDWHRDRKDVNNDSALSYEEFQLDANLFASALSRRIFRLLDRDYDGKLGYEEFPFSMDPSKIPPQIAFKIQDKDGNGKLVFAEVFTESTPVPADKSGVERYEMRLAAAESRFLADDRDRDGGLSLAEFQQSREAAMAAVERKTKALSRHRQTTEGNWFYPAVLAVNAVVLLGGGWYLLRRSA